MSLNRDSAKLKEFVDRAFDIKNSLNEAKNEAKDLLADLRTEIKGGFDVSGIEYKEVMRLSDIRLEEQKAKDKSAEMKLDIATYDLLYGKSGEDDLLD